MNEILILGIFVFGVIAGTLLRSYVLTLRAKETRAEEKRFWSQPWLNGGSNNG